MPVIHARVKAPFDKTKFATSSNRDIIVNPVNSQMKAATSTKAKKIRAR